MSDESFHGCVPIFRVSDLDSAVDHYCAVLGFERVFAYGDPPFYAEVRRGPVRLHLTAADDDPRGPGVSSVYVFVADADETFGELSSAGARILKEPLDYSYGMRDFDVEDLDGNKLAFGSPLGDVQ